MENKCTKLNLCPYKDTPKRVCYCQVLIFSITTRNNMFEHTRTSTFDGNWIAVSTTQKSIDRLKKLKKDNLRKRSPAENEANKIIKTYGFKYTRQAIWHTRLFDFWFGIKGVAIEIDGGTHNNPGQKLKDKISDKHFYNISGIIVIRVKDYDLDGIRKIMDRLQFADSWQDRRKKMGIVKASLQRKKFGLKDINKGAKKERARAKKNRLIAIKEILSR